MPLQQQMPVVVEIADERRQAACVEHALLDFGHGGGGLGRVHGDSNELGAGLSELDALSRGRCGVSRLGHRHALDGDRRASADLNATDFDWNSAMYPHRDWHQLK